jgi:hypothetical protein
MDYGLTLSWKEGPQEVKGAEGERLSEQLLLKLTHLLKILFLVLTHLLKYILIIGLSHLLKNFLILGLRLSKIIQDPL